MSCRFVCIVIFLAEIGLSVIIQNGTDDRCGIQDSEKQYPWLAGIEFENSYMGTLVVICIGALINRNYVVSTAPCFDMDILPQSVRLGPNIPFYIKKCDSKNCSDDNTIRTLIEVVIRHPDYGAYKLAASEAESNYNIALVKLRDMVSYSGFIQPICLPSSDITQSAAINRELYFTGVYHSAPNEYIRNNIGAAMTYMDRAEYIKANSGLLLVKDQISAKHIKEPQDISACMVIGGILVNRRRSNYELVGLLDVGSGCMSAKRFTHVFLYLDWIQSQIGQSTPCGRRQVEHVELIINAEDTKAGDWPWHVAIYRLQISGNKYICGGTLISKKTVLTAAHCTTVSGKPVAPEILSVGLGKYYLIGANLESQEREVHSVIVHEDFAPGRYLDNDISLLKLRTEASYSDYVQPACIWSNEVLARLPINRDFGTVVGWGFDQTEALSSQLRQAIIPKVSDMTCIRKKPLFYVNALANDKKFCAGWANGTSPCNGDSGGGFLVFVPDIPKDDSSDARGSWYIRGIISMTVSLRDHARCDPYQYVVFTNVDNYTDWIQRH